MSAFDFANAPRSFSRNRTAGRELDGAMWCHLQVCAGRLGLPAVPPHRLGLDWACCFHGLGVALGRHEVRRIEMQVAQQAWATSPIARRGAMVDAVERVQIGGDGQPDETTRSIEVLG